MNPIPSLSSRARRFLFCIILSVGIPDAFGCCALARPGSEVVNADQTVILIWDKVRQMQHFIRQASFKSDAPDVGFLVPSPTKPELAESGDTAFPRLREITAPVYTGRGFGCAAAPLAYGLSREVRVLEEKRVAGFDAAVLEADSGKTLTGWLRRNGYSYSSSTAAWAQPYVEKGWKITALKVAKSREKQKQDTESL